MPQAKRSTKKGRAASTKAAQTKKPARSRAKAAESEDDEDEDDEDEQPAKRGRAPRDYGVTGEQLQEMRDDGMGWLEIMEEVGAKSAIPLRKILHAYQAEQDEDFQLDIDDGEAIVAARDEEGLGWGQIAARADATVAEVKSAYTEAGGENLEGRAYRSKDGSVHFKLGSTNGAVDDEDEDEQEEEEPTPKRRRGAKAASKPAAAPKGNSKRRAAKAEADDTEDEDEAPKPKPRRRAAKK